MRYILQIIKPYWKKLTVSLSLKSLGALSDLVLPWIIAYMLDTQIPALEANNPDLWPLYQSGIFMVMVALIGVYFNISANRRAERIAADAVKILRHDLFEKVVSLSARQVDQLTRPSLISRMTTDTYNMYTASAGMQRLGVRAPVLLIGGIVMSLFLDPMMTLVMVAILPFIALIVWTTSRVGIPLYKKTQKSVDKLIRTLREYVTGARVVRALSMKDYEENRFDHYNEETVDAELKATITMARINPLMRVVMNVGLVFVLVTGAFRINSYHAETGELLAFVTYFTIILNAMMGITRVFVISSRASASGERIFEVINMPIDLQEGHDDLVKDLRKPHIKFRDVSFSYLQHKSNLEHVNFEIKKGQTLGIIGATGSGKTTIINLLMRFYDVDQGAIEIYGKNIKNIKQNALRSSIGVVFQNDLIFADSIYGNIQFNRDQITNEEIEEATRIAQADFVYEKDADFDYQMAQKGRNLSGGQKQRVLIARAVAGKPDIIVLDDASSALDYETDMSMRQALKDMLKNTTKIVVAQRISSLRDSDLILLVDDGKIIAQGTHESLMKTSKTYREIASYQLGGEA